MSARSCGTIGPPGTGARGRYPGHHDPGPHAATEATTSMLLVDAAPVPYRAPRTTSFAQVLAEATIQDAGAIAWRRVPVRGFAIPSGAVEDVRMADGSRVAIWEAAGAWVAACARPGDASVSVVAVPGRPTITAAVALAQLADAAASGR